MASPSSGASASPSLGSGVQKRLQYAATRAAPAKRAVPRTLLLSHAVLHASTSPLLNASSPSLSLSPSPSNSSAPLLPTSLSSPAMARKLGSSSSGLDTIKLSKEEARSLLRSSDAQPSAPSTSSLPAMSSSAAEGLAQVRAVIETAQLSGEALWQGSRDVLPLVLHFHDELKAAHVYPENLVSFDMPEIGEKVYRVDRTLPVSQLVSSLFAKHALPDASHFTLATLGGVPLHARTCLAHYGLGSLFKHWMLKVLRTPNPATSSSLSSTSTSNAPTIISASPATAAKRAKLLRHETSSSIVEAPALDRVVSVLVVVVGAALVDAEDVPPLLRLCVEAVTTVAQLCALAADMLGLTDPDLDTFNNPQTPNSDSPIPSIANLGPTLSTSSSTLMTSGPSTPSNNTPTPPINAVSTPTPTTTNTPPQTPMSALSRWQFTVRTVPSHSGAVPELLKEDRTLGSLSTRSRHVAVQLSVSPRGAAAVRALVASSVRGVVARVMDDLHRAREEQRVALQRAQAERSALAQERSQLETKRAQLLAKAEDFRKERDRIRDQLNEAQQEKLRRERQLKDQEAKAAQAQPQGAPKLKDPISNNNTSPNKEGNVDNNNKKLSEEQLLARQVTAADKEEAEKLFRSQLNALRRQIATLRAESVSERGRSLELIAKREAEVRARKGLSEERQRQQTELRRGLAALALATERAKESLRSTEERNKDLRRSVTHLKLHQVGISEQLSTAESTLRDSHSARGAAVRAISPRSAKPRVSVSLAPGLNTSNPNLFSTLTPNSLTTSSAPLTQPPPPRPRQPLPSTKEFESTMEELSGFIASTSRDVELAAIIAAATPRDEDDYETAETLGPVAEEGNVPATWDDSFWTDITGQ